MNILFCLSNDDAFLYKNSFMQRLITMDLTFILVEPNSDHYFPNVYHCPISNFDKTDVTYQSNIFDGENVNAKGIVRYCKMKFSEEECKFGSNREELEQFVDNVRSKTPSKLTFWTDNEINPNKGEILFNGNEFLYPIFDYGHYSDHIRTKFEVKHLEDLEKILSKWE